MNSQSIVATLLTRADAVRNRIGLVVAHGQDVVRTGAETVQAARTVIVNGGREAIGVAARTREELARTLRDGATRIGGKLTRIATPSHAEVAEARKLEVKAKKKRKAAQAEAAQAEAALAEGPAIPAT